MAPARTPGPLRLKTGVWGSGGRGDPGIPGAFALPVTLEATEAASAHSGTADPCPLGGPTVRPRGACSAVRGGAALEREMK